MKAIPMDTQVTHKNVLGTELQLCCREPLTGFYRNGFCQTDTRDVGTHVVCARMTEAFLQFSKARGNNLIDAVPAYGFPGLRPGDKWCLCANRWLQAHAAGVAPPVYLAATHASLLERVTLEVLDQYAVEPEKP